MTCRRSIDQGAQFSLPRQPAAVDARQDGCQCRFELRQRPTGPQRQCGHPVVPVKLGDELRAAKPARHQISSDGIPLRRKGRPHEAQVFRKKVAMAAPSSSASLMSSAARLAFWLSGRPAFGMTAMPAGSRARARSRPLVGRRRRACGRCQAVPGHRDALGDSLQGGFLSGCCAGFRGMSCRLRRAGR